MRTVEFTVRLLDILAYVAMTIFGILLAGIAFTRAKRKKYPALTWLDGKQLYFLLGFLLAAGTYTVLSITQEVLGNRRSFQIIDLSEFSGEKATSQEFGKELSRRLPAKAKEATDYFDAAEQDFAARRYADAALLYEKSVEAVPTMSAYLNGGIALTQSGKRENASLYFAKGLEIARRDNDSVFKSNFLSNLAIETADTGDFSLAEQYAQAALTISRETKLRSHEARALTVLATILGDEGNLEKAVADAKASISIYNSLKDEDGEATGLATLGYLQAENDVVNEGISNLQHALRLHQKTSNINGQIKVLTNLGIVFSNHGNLNEALESEEAALKIATPESAALDRANLLNNIGTLFWRKHDFKLSERYETDALKAYEDLGSKSGAASALNNLGLDHADSGSLDAAAKDFTKAAEAFEIISKKDEESEALANVAEILRREKKYHESVFKSLRALEVAQSVNYHTGIADASGTLGLAYSALGQKQQAISALQRACSLAKQYQLNIDQLSDYQAELQKLTGEGEARKTN